VAKGVITSHSNKNINRNNVQVEKSLRELVLKSKNSGNEGKAVQPLPII
jgi:hypothetical protein